MPEFSSNMVSKESFLSNFVFDFGKVKVLLWSQRREPSCYARRGTPCRRPGGETTSPVP